MNVRVFREPCYFAEAVYLLYAFVNHVSYEDDYRRVRQGYSRLVSQDDAMEQRVRELSRIVQEVTEDLDPEDERLRHYFEKLPGTDQKTCCCLAQVMLMSIPLDCSDIDQFAAQLSQAYQSMASQGIKVNDMNGMGLIIERWEEDQERETLAAQLDRLPCAVEAKWEILRVLTDFDAHLRQLTRLIHPVAKRLQTAMVSLNAANEALLEQWGAYFQTHTVDDFQNEMFNTTFLFTEENRPHEIWLGIWNFNMFGTWSEWIDNADPPACVAYLGMCITFDYAVTRKDRPDAESLCAMVRALGGKDKLEILHRCAQGPVSAARLAAAMKLNSGTVSRNLYSLFKLGYLETKGDGERVNYVTRLDTIEQVFHWIMEYITDSQ